MRMTRREWLASGGLLVASACGPKKGTGYPGYALIATAGEDSLAVVDLASFRLRQPIDLGAAPAVVVSGGPAGYSYVLTPTSGRVHIIDNELRRVTSRQLGDQISGIRLAPDGRRLFAISSQTPELIEADSQSLQVRKRYRLPAVAVDLDVPPPPDPGELPKPPYIAVSTGEHGAVEFFNYETGRHQSAQIPGTIGAVRFRADGLRLLVANLQDRSLTALDSPTLGMIAELPLAMKPQNLCFNSDQGQLFISGDGMDGVAIVFPYTPLEVEQTVLAGRDPGVMACSATPSYLFVGSNSGSDLFILNIDTRMVIGLLDCGGQPTYITTTPDSQYALVLEQSAGTMAVIRIPTIRADPSIVRRVETPSATLFTMLPVGDKPVHAAVVHRKT